MVERVCVDCLTEKLMSHSEDASDRRGYAVWSLAIVEKPMGDWACFRCGA